MISATTARYPSSIGCATLRTVVPIVRCGALAHDLCRHRADLIVAAVFDRCVYLQSGGTLICIGEPSLGNGPLTLIADIATGRLSALGIRVGQPAQADCWSIRVGDSIAFAMDQCSVWRQPPWPAVPTLHQLADIPKMIALRAAHDAPFDGLARVACGTSGEIASGGLIGLTARTRIARLTSWLSDPAAADRGGVNLLDAICGLVGLGPGLTPSGDDFLTGAVLLLDALAHRHHKALQRALLRVPPDLTSALSLCLLRAAAEGHASEMAHRTVSSLVTGDVDAAITAVRTIGHSSGWDMLAGIATTLAVVATQDARLLGQFRRR